MIKYINIIIFVACVVNPINAVEKPRNVPKESRFLEYTSKLDNILNRVWILDKKNSGNSIYITWNVDGGLRHIFLNIGPFRYRTEYFPEVKNRMKYTFGVQDCNFKISNDEAYSIPYGLHLDYHEYGGTVKRKTCTSLKMHPDSRTGARTADEPYGVEKDLCGEELHYDKQGNIIKRIQHKKCDNECGFFMPFLTPGEYKMRSKTNVRENPDIKSTSIRMLNPGDKIKVVKDTHLMQTLYGTTAPWLEIQMDDGKKGYIFGGLIDIENLWVNVEGFDFRELLNTKFIDKQPQYCFEDK
jgi:hypothetical protein